MKEAPQWRAAVNLALLVLASLIFFEPNSRGAPDVGSPAHFWCLAVEGASLAVCLTARCCRRSHGPRTFRRRQRRREAAPKEDRSPLDLKLSCPSPPPATPAAGSQNAAITALYLGRERFTKKRCEAQPGASPVPAVTADAEPDGSR